MLSKFSWRSILLWFDTKANHDYSYHNLNGIDWMRTIPFLILHLSVFTIFWTGINCTLVSIAAISYVVRMFAITGFYHRYFSHRAFKTSRFMQFCFAVLGNAAIQRGPIWWASHHRLHHKHSDKPADAHSPVHKGFLDSHCKWFLQKQYFYHDSKNVSDLMNFPEIQFLDRFDMLVPCCYAILLYFIGQWLGSLGYPCNGKSCLIWGIGISTVVLYHCTFAINSLSHIFGKRVFATKDNSKNNLLLAIITMGEGWHNNHHYYPSSVRQGFRRLEIDITYYILLALKKLRIIYDLRLPPNDILNEQIQLQ